MGLIVGVDRVFISFLQFPYYMFFLEPDIDSFVNILSILGFSKVICDLKINLAKGRLVGITMYNQVLNAFATLEGC